MAESECGSGNGKRAGRSLAGNYLKSNNLAEANSLHVLGVWFNLIYCFIEIDPKTGQHEPEQDQL